MGDPVSARLAELRAAIEKTHPTPSRAKSLALTKLDELEMWIRECPPSDETVAAFEQQLLSEQRS